MNRTTAALALLSFYLIGHIHADDRSPGPLLIPIKGERAVATLVSMSEEGEVQFRVGKENRRLLLDELVAWGSPAEPRTDRQLILADGSILPLRRDPLPATEQDRLVVVSDTFGELKLPLKLLAGVMLHAPIAPQRRDELAARLRSTNRQANAAATSKNADRLLLENGDELRGRIVALTDSAVEFEAELGALTVEIERVAALAFNPSLRATAQADNPRSLVGFGDGSFVAVASIRIIEGRTKMTLADGSNLSTTEAPVYLQPLGGSVKYLSDVQPTSYRHLPYLSLPFAYQLDANVEGTRLRAGGKIYPKGIGMHSTARLSWQLEKTYRRFAADLAIDDQTQLRGSVVFRVFSGSREIYKSAIVRGGDAPLPIWVDIRDARQLSLVVDYADRADVLDHADWLNARLVP